MYDAEMNEVKKKVDKMLLPKSKEYQQGRADERAERNIARIVDLKELGVDDDTFEKIYRMGEEDGREDFQKDYCESCVHKVTKADIDAIEATARADEREKIKKKFDEIDKMDIQENALKYSMFKSWIKSHK